MDSVLRRSVKVAAVLRKKVDENPQPTGKQGRAALESCRRMKSSLRSVDCTTARPAHLLHIATSHLYGDYAYISTHPGKCQQCTHTHTHTHWSFALRREAVPIAGHTTLSLHSHPLPPLNLPHLDSLRKRATPLPNGYVTVDRSRLPLPTKSSQVHIFTSKGR